MFIAAFKKLIIGVASKAYRLYLLQRKQILGAIEAPNPLETEFGADLSVFMKAKYQQHEKESENIRVGYAILIHERFDYLVDCLETLYEAKYDGIEVTFFLVDDGSEDSRIRDLLMTYESSHIPTKVFFCAKTQSTSAAVTNRALGIMSKYGPFDVYGFGDPDCIYHPDWLQTTLKLQSWLFSNYTNYKIGMISPYNSVSREFHVWLDEGQSPYGGFVAKQQMGWPSVILKPEYLLEVGLMHETPQDENLYTARLQKLGYANFSLKESLVEHIGQNSLLNNFRAVPVTRADFSFSLMKSGWPNKIYNYTNPTIVRDLLSSEVPENSQTEVDVIFNLGEKDLPVFRGALESIETYLGHPIKEIFVVTTSSLANSKNLKSLEINVVDEFDLFPYRLPYSHAGLPEIDRSGWIYQQFLKLSSDLLGTSKKKLITDADNLLVRQTAFIDDEDDSKTIIPVSPYYKSEYHEAFIRIFQRELSNHLCFVCHMMIFDVHHLKQLKSAIEEIHGLEWWLAIYSQIDLTKVSSFSEFDTYAHYVQLANANEYKLTSWNLADVSAQTFVSLSEAVQKYQSNFRNVGFQHWVM